MMTKNSQTHYGKLIGTLIIMVVCSLGALSLRAAAGRAL